MNALQEIEILDMLSGNATAPPAWQDCTDIAVEMADGRLTRGLAALVGAIGQEAFSCRLIELLTAAAAIDQFNMITLDEADEACCVYTWHRARADLGANLVGRYVEGRFHTRDPALAALRRPQLARLRMGVLLREQIEDDWYRRFFFDEAKLGGKLSILEQNTSHGIYQNFYSPAGISSFSPREMQNLATLSEVVSQCVIRHRDLTAPRINIHHKPDREEVARLLAKRAPTLAPRELDVCSRIVTGYTTEAIALNLGIAQNSVATYRKRAYAKLRICSQHELFLLCLGTNAIAPLSRP